MTHFIQAAGAHLLAVLKAEKAVPYSRFYNATPDTELALADAVVRLVPNSYFEEINSTMVKHRETLIEEAHLFVEWAAWQLESLRLVTIETLPGSKLIDGEPDFRIALTRKGEAFVADGKAFKAHSLNARFDVTQASEWLFAFAESNCETAGEGFVFGIVADLGESEGEVVVTDDDGNTYPRDTVPYEWAFQVSLWHHVRQGVLKVVPEMDEQRELWEKQVNRTHLFQHHEFPPSLQKIMYTITPKGLELGKKVKHVGWIGGG